MLEKLVLLHNYENHFLPDALRYDECIQYLPPLRLSLPLRYLFSKIPAPKERGPFLDRLLDLFLMQYKSCNEGLSYGTGKGREGEREREREIETETGTERERERDTKREREYVHIHE